MEIIEESNSGPSRVRLVVGLLVAVGVFYVIVSSMMSSGAYFLSVDQAVARPVTNERPIRVKGTVVVGSYLHEEGTTIHQWKVADKEGAQELSVYYDGPMPDVFKEGGEVVVEGPRDAKGVLVATEVTAKCPSKYENDGISDQAKERLDRPGS
jgi:cytochrome c-type biogenesis protein CcmE